MIHDGITDVAFQKRPYPILWCVCNGDLIAITYDRNDKVVAATKVPTIGDIHSIAIIPTDSYDQLWYSAEYGSDIYFCYLAELDIRKDVEDNHFVEAGLYWKGGTGTVTGITNDTEGVVTLSAWPTDSDGNDLADGDQITFYDIEGMTELNGNTYDVYSANKTALTLKLKSGGVVINTTGYGTYTSGGTLKQVENSFGGLGHLDGYSAKATLNGVRSEDVTISGGTVTLTDYVHSVSIGLWQNREIRLFPPEGREIGANKLITGFTFGFVNSNAGQYAPVDREGNIIESRVRNFDFVNAIDFYGWDDDTYTGIMKVRDNFGVLSRLHLAILLTEPRPLTLTMIEPEAR
jgi:hypothetical protein